MIGVQVCVLREHLSWETAFAGQKRWYLKTGSTIGLYIYLQPSYTVILINVRMSRLASYCNQVKRLSPTYMHILFEHHCTDKQ